MTIWYVIKPSARQQGKAFLSPNPPVYTSAALAQAQLEGPSTTTRRDSEQAPGMFQEAARYLNEAVQGLREAGTQHNLPLGLLARAALHRATRASPEAWNDLAEAREIAEGGEMKLHLADFHLEATRLSLAEGKKDRAREHLAAAREMIEEMGYGRRKGEAEEIQFTIYNFQLPI